MKKKCTALKYYFSISNQNTLKERHHFLTMVRIDNWSQKSQRFLCLWVTSKETHHKYSTLFETGCNHNLFHWDKSSIKINKIPYSEASIITNYFCLNKTHVWLWVYHHTMFEFQELLLVIANYFIHVKTNINKWPCTGVP